MGVRCNDKLGHREGTFGEIPNSSISALIIRFKMREKIFNITKRYDSFTSCCVIPIITEPLLFVILIARQWSGPSNLGTLTYFY